MRNALLDSKKMSELKSMIGKVDEGQIPIGIDFQEFKLSNLILSKVPLLEEEEDGKALFTIFDGYNVREKEYQDEILYILEDKETLVAKEFSSRNYVAWEGKLLSFRIEKEYFEYLDYPKRYLCMMKSEGELFIWLHRSLHQKYYSELFSDTKGIRIML